MSHANIACFPEIGAVLHLCSEAAIETHDPSPDYESGTTGRRRPRVLIVDDEKLVADSLSEILRRFQYDAIPFYSGETAIESARQSCPDIVISDVVMPQLNGVETVLRIQEVCSRARILLLSGNAATADLLMQARANGNHFELLAKPIHPEELLRKLQCIGEKNLGI